MKTIRIFAALFLLSAQLVAQDELVRFDYSDCYTVSWTDWHVHYQGGPYHRRYMTAVLTGPGPGPADVVALGISEPDDSGLYIYRIYSPYPTTTAHGTAELQEFQSWQLESQRIVWIWREQ